MFQVVKQGAVHVLSGDAPLSGGNVAEAKSLVAGVLAKNQARLVLDLKDVPLLDSTGLEMLLTVRDDCLRAGGSLQLANAGPLCRDILVATGIAEQFAIFDNLAAAVGSYAR